MICGLCGMTAHELPRPSSRHARIAYCLWCKTFKTFFKSTQMPKSLWGWTRTTTPPQWARTLVGAGK